jgi:short-subunit dehydrogenase
MNENKGSLVFVGGCAMSTSTSAQPNKRQKVTRTLLIAGGTDGIGFAFLETESQLKSRYSTIYCLGRNFQQVRQLADARIIDVACDVTDTNELRRAMSLVSQPIDDFVITIGTFVRGPVSELRDEDVTQHFQVNVIANIQLIRAVLPKMRLPASSGSTGAQLVLCSASLASQARSPYALQSATKAGLKFFVDALRIELKGKVRVMTCLPPSVDTKIFAKAGDPRDTSNYPPASRVADAMRFLLELPPDVSVPELALEQHDYQRP